MTGVGILREVKEKLALPFARRSAVQGEMSPASIKGVLDKLQLKKQGEVYRACFLPKGITYFDVWADSKKWQGAATGWGIRLEGCDESSSWSFVASIDTHGRIISAEKTTTRPARRRMAGSEEKKVLNQHEAKMAVADALKYCDKRYQALAENVYRYCCQELGGFRSKTYEENIEDPVAGHKIYHTLTRSSKGIEIERKEVYQRGKGSDTDETCIAGMRVPKGIHRVEYVAKALFPTERMPGMSDADEFSGEPDAAHIKTFNAYYDAQGKLKSVQNRFSQFSSLGGDSSLGVDTLIFSFQDLMCRGNLKLIREK